MKQKLLLLLLSFLLTVPNILNAETKSFWNVVSYSLKQNGNMASVDAIINGSRVVASWYNPDGNKSFDDGEKLIGTAKLYNRDGKLAMQSDNNVNKDQFNAWAETNAKQILGVVFPVGVSETTGQTDDALFATSTVGNILQKVTPKAEKSKVTSSTESINSDFKGAVEWLKVDVNNKSGNAYSAILGYGYDFDSGLKLDLLIPYRYTSMSDELDSKSHFIGLDAALKYPLQKWNNLSLNIGGDIFGSVFYLKTAAIENSGNVKYGLGAFTSLVNEFSFGTLSLGLDYKFSKAYIPSSLIDTDNKFVNQAVDYVNNLSAVNTISYGFNFGIPFFNGKAAANLEAIRSHFISSDTPDGRKQSTVVGLGASYLPSEVFSFNLGVRKTFELQDIDIWGVMLGAVYKF